ncbi:hypothetical protein LIER_29246 [Lithospermum erythrorhizon]|uniref:Uncharacterized protein n=1 Tax=Lithospermum erythrorhizon TaxID=34254 RepID=A0AAV3RJJ2_LITER
MTEISINFTLRNIWLILYSFKELASSHNVRSLKDAYEEGSGSGLTTVLEQNAHAVQAGSSSNLQPTVSNDMRGMEQHKSKAGVIDTVASDQHNLSLDDANKQIDQLPRKSPVAAKNAEKQAEATEKMSALPPVNIPTSRAPLVEKEGTKLVHTADSLEEKLISEAVTTIQLQEQHAHNEVSTEHVTVLQVEAHIGGSYS